MEKIIELVKEKSGVRILFSLNRINKDFLVTAEGGDVPHIGAVSLNRQTTALSEHKEYVITQDMAEMLVDGTGHNCCVAGGIHVNDITKAQIAAVMDMCHEAAGQLADLILELDKKGVVDDGR